GSQQSTSVLAPCRQYSQAPIFPSCSLLCFVLYRYQRVSAYTRLAINLKTHLKRPQEEQLDVVKTACDDDCVRGGDRVDLWER
ncbi:unnamed protein product, partial [Ectocarpus sp. 13 AM-2016]